MNTSEILGLDSETSDIILNSCIKDHDLSFPNLKLLN